MIENLYIIPVYGFLFRIHANNLGYESQHKIFIPYIGAKLPVLGGLHCLKFDYLAWFARKIQITSKMAKTRGFLKLPRFFEMDFEIE